MHNKVGSPLVARRGTECVEYQRLLATNTLDAHDPCINLIGVGAVRLMPSCDFPLLLLFFNWKVR